MFGKRFFGGRFFGARYFGPSGGGGGGGPSLPAAPFEYALVPLGSLVRQDFPNAPVSITDLRDYGIPVIRLENGLTLQGQQDWRGFTITLPAVTRTDN
jgi:hypothetical protein